MTPPSTGSGSRSCGRGSREVAAGNPHAWLQRAYTAEEIATPSPANRMVAAPYTKLLTANIQVNMATGLILTSAAAAEHAGVPTDRWIFIHAGAQAHERWHVAERRTLSVHRRSGPWAAPPSSRPGVTIDEVAHLDVYSCFPSAVQIAARELGLAIDEPGRDLTVTGGLTFAGGPGNNYTSHAIASLMPRLRADPDGVWPHDRGRLVPDQARRRHLLRPSPARAVPHARAAAAAAGAPDRGHAPHGAGRDRGLHGPVRPRGLPPRRRS